MGRFLIVAILFGLIFWLARNYGRGTNPEEGLAGNEIHELVPDALTGVYFPKPEAVVTTRGGQTLYFISVGNRDKYLEQVSRRPQ